LAGNAQNGFAFDPFVVGMHYLDQNSQVAYATTGSAGSRVFKIQWKDMGIKNMPNEKINMQAWFKEQDGSIEFHFGNSVCSAVAQSGIFFLTADFSAVHDAYWLGGNPDNPQLNENAAFKVNGIPSTGVVYRFSATPNSVKEVKQKISMTCYPNPSTGKFQLSETGINELKAVDMMGRTIEVSYDGQFFALPPSASGVYFLYGNDEEGNLFQGKIILDHRP